LIGGGSGLNSLNASNISSGTISNDLLPDTINVTDLIGGGSGLNSLNASNISSGTISNDLLPDTINVTDLIGGGSGLNSLNASNISSGTISNDLLPDTINVTDLIGGGSGLNSLNASNISSGTIDISYIADESITLAKLNSDVTLAGVTVHGATTSDIVSFTNTTDAADGVGAVKITGGLYVAKKIYAGDDITAFSDRRKKSNIERIENALDKVSQLNGYTFDYNGERKTGVIAQEVNEVLPEAVYGSEDTTYSVAYGNLVGILIEAIKELKNEINQLKNT